MKKYVALLRGINVGGNNRVEMKKLKTVFESLGYANVSTYINSGNVIFESSKNEKDLLVEIEKAIQKNFGLVIKTLICDSNNFEKLTKRIPADWKNDTKMRTDILFLWDFFDTKSLLKLIVSNKDVDRLICVPRAIVWNVDRKNFGKSGMKKFIGTELYKNMTARNVDTVRKLEGLLS